MKIDYNGKTYNIDMEEAIKQKIAKPIILDFNIGDVFAFSPQVKGVIIYDETTRRYVLGGNSDDPFHLYVDSAKTKDEMLEYFNKHNVEFVKHIDISI
jgi:hypothetical protein